MWQLKRTSLDIHGPAFVSGDCAGRAGRTLGVCSDPFWDILREIFKYPSDTARPPQLDAMQLINIDGAFQRQPNQPEAETDCVFKTSSSHRPASVITQLGLC